MAGKEPRHGDPLDYKEGRGDYYLREGKREEREVMTGADVKRQVMEALPIGGYVTSAQAKANRELRTALTPCIVLTAEEAAWGAMLAHDFPEVVALLTPDQEASYVKLTSAPPGTEIVTGSEIVTKPLVVPDQEASDE